MQSERISAEPRGIQKLLGTGPPGPGALSPTGRLKNVLEMALREAHSLRSTHVRSEHVLLGLAREGGGLGARVLAERGVGYEQLRTRVDGPRWPALLRTQRPPCDLRALRASLEANARGLSVSDKTDRGLSGTIR